MAAQARLLASHGFRPSRAAAAVGLAGVADAFSRAAAATEWLLQHVQAAYCVDGGGVPAEAAAQAAADRRVLDHHNPFCHSESGGGGAGGGMGGVLAGEVPALGSES